jgi:hypothetical protein
MKTNSVNDYVSFLRKNAPTSFSERALNKYVYGIEIADGGTYKKYKELLRRAVSKGLVEVIHVTGKRHRLEYKFSTQPLIMPNFRHRVMEILGLRYGAYLSVFSDRRKGNRFRVKFWNEDATPAQMNEIEKLSKHVKKVYRYSGSLCIVLDCRMRDLINYNDTYITRLELRAMVTYIPGNCSPLPAKKAEPVDKFDFLKKAHAEGKTIELYFGEKWQTILNPLFDDDFCNYRIKSDDKFADLQKAYDAGDKIEVLLLDGTWCDIVEPGWSPEYKYRVKTAPKNMPKSVAKSKESILEEIELLVKQLPKGTTCRLVLPVTTIATYNYTS